MAVLFETVVRKKKKENYLQRTGMFAQKTAGGGCSRESSWELVLFRFYACLCMEYIKVQLNVVEKVAKDSAKTCSVRVRLSECAGAMFCWFCAWCWERSKWTLECGPTDPGRRKPTKCQRRLKNHIQIHLTFNSF